MLKNKDSAVGVASIAVAAILFIASFGIKEMTTTSSAGAGFLPRITALILAALGAILIVRQMRADAVAAKSGVKPAEKKESKAKEPPVGLTGPLPVILNILLFVVYLLLLEKIGFLIMTPIYMVFQIYLLSDTIKFNWVKYLAISIAVCVAAYYLFVGFFQVMLPAGILG